MKRIVISIIFAMVFSFTLLVGYAYTEPILIFKGTPFVKISEAGSSRVVEKLGRGRSTNLKLLISKKNKQYFWASRDNKMLLRVESGAFITFVARDGVGYIRIVNPKSKKVAGSIMSDTEENFDYVEHLLLGLRSVTYYGRMEIIDR